MSDTLHTFNSSGTLESDYGALDYGFNGPSSINFGESLVLVLATENQTNGTEIPYVITGVTTGDLGGQPLTGNLVVTDNLATLTYSTSSKTVKKTLVITATGYEPFEVVIYPTVNVEYMIVAGGGAGGGNLGGGGGAGGYLAGNTDIRLGFTYTITVGAGGAGVAGTQNGVTGNRGVNTTALGFTAQGGGGGGGGSTNTAPGSGGSGGGGSGYGTTAGGAGTSGQGNNGGAGGGGSTNYPGGGGGGSAGVGETAAAAANKGSAGGPGTLNDILGRNFYWAAGGGGSGYASNAGAGDGGIGGGGGGGTGTGPVGLGGDSAINAGRAGNYLGSNAAGSVNGGGPGGQNTGSGGGGTGHRDGVSGAGGSGIVVVRYPAPQKGTGGTVIEVDGDIVHIFYSSGQLIMTDPETAVGLDSNLDNALTGDTVVVTLATDDLAANTAVSYTITGVDTDDIDGASLTGNFTVVDDYAELALNITNKSRKTLTISTTNYGSKSIQLAPAMISKALIVAGGGGGGMDMGGGGGGGGVISQSDLQITPGRYIITIGAGGSGAPTAGTGAGTQGRTTHQYTIPATKGVDSSFFNLTALGGGFGGTSYWDYTPGPDGTTGGSAGGTSGYANAAVTFRTPASGTPLQGHRGGRGGGQYYSGGGGGAGGPGKDSPFQADGGPGLEDDILGTSYYWGGGGGGSGYTINGGNGGIGGGGGGAVGTTTGGVGFNNGQAGGGGTTVAQTNKPGGNGGANTGGGGGGGSHYTATNQGGNGGSGIVAIRYTGTQKAIGGNVATVGSDTVHTFTSSGELLVFPSEGFYTDSNSVTSGNSIVVYYVDESTETGNVEYTITGVTSSVINGDSLTGNFVMSGGIGQITINTSKRNRQENLTISAGGFVYTISVVPSLFADILVVAGGGGGGAHVPGGGGAGGLIFRPNVDLFTFSLSYPLPITVGAGGIGSYNPGSYGGMPNSTAGGDSTFGSYLTAKGGGFGDSWNQDSRSNNGGSGGGANGNQGGAGTATQPSQSGDSGLYGFGNNGAAGGPNAAPYPAGGGGGAGSAGQAVPNNNTAGNGGAGKYYGDVFSDSIGENGWFAGGGGGGAWGFVSGGRGNGGLGGGGDGDCPTGSGTGESVRRLVGEPTGESGITNTGGGGGGAGRTGAESSRGGNGGSGILALVYQGAPKGQGGEIVFDGVTTQHIYTTSDNFTLSIPEQGIYADRSQINLGETVYISVFTDGLNDGTDIAYTISGVNSNDISGDPLSGNVVVNNNEGILEITTDPFNKTNKTMTVSVSLPDSELLVYQVSVNLIYVLPVQYLLVGGGGGGGSEMGGGGGGGGVLSGNCIVDTGDTYSVLIGAGGAGAPAGINQVRGGSGGSTIFVPTSAVPLSITLDLFSQPLGTAENNRYIYLGGTTWQYWQYLPSYLAGLPATYSINDNDLTNFSTNKPVRVYLVRQPTWSNAVDLTGYSLLEENKTYISTATTSVWYRDFPAGGPYPIDNNSAMYLFEDLDEQKITAYGGGGGASTHTNPPAYSAATIGGSGGGASGKNSNRGWYYPGQGFPGANSAGEWYPGGGGGAGGAGATNPANGGNGILNNILGTGYYWGGGGGGAGYTVQGGNGGLGGAGGGAPKINTGGNAGASGLNPGTNAETGTLVSQTNKKGGSAGANTGSGGGGGSHYNLTNNGGNGGSGICVLKYPGAQKILGGIVTYHEGNFIHSFYTSSTFSVIDEEGLFSNTPTQFFGETIVISYITTETANGTTIPYTITNVDSGDVNVPLSGNLTVNANESILEIGTTAGIIDIKTLTIAADGYSQSIVLTYIESLTSPVAISGWGIDLVITLKTRNLTDGTLVPYEITGVNSSDIDNLPLTGNLTITNNQNILTITTDDTIRDDKTLVLTLGGGYSLSVPIRGVSVSPGVRFVTPQSNSFLTLSNPTEDLFLETKLIPNDIVETSRTVVGMLTPNTVAINNVISSNIGDLLEQTIAISTEHQGYLSKSDSEQVNNSGLLKSSPTYVYTDGAPVAAPSPGQQQNIQIWYLN